MALTKIEQPLRFMDFPGEIRNECYKLLLYVPNGRIEISYQKIGRDYQAVNGSRTPKTFNQAYLTLLLINKAINKEASHFLYSQNIFAVNIHIAYTSSDPMIGPDRDNLFKRQNKRYQFRDKGLITPACFRQIAHIEINLIYLARPVANNANTFRPFIVRKILHILRDGAIKNCAPKENTLKITHHPGDIGNEVWNGRQSLLRRELMKEVDPLLADARMRRVVKIPDIPSLAEWM